MWITLVRNLHAGARFGLRPQTAFETHSLMRMCCFFFVERTVENSGRTVRPQPHYLIRCYANRVDHGGPGGPPPLGLGPLAIMVSL